MNLIKEKSYSFYGNYSNNTSILVLSDIHFSKYVVDKTYDLFKHVSLFSFNYLLIPGDLIDHFGVLKENDVCNKIIECFKLITDTGRKIILILGNHEYYLSRKKQKFIRDVINSEFYCNLKKMDNVYVLNNENYSDDFVDIFGMSLPLSYYHKTKFFENKNVLLKELSIYQNKIDKVVNSDKIKILMIHSPKFINDSELLSITSKFDVVLCGHFHNGSVPVLLDDIWKSNRGLVGASFDKLPKNSRGLIGKNIVVSGAVNFIQTGKIKFKFIDLFYPVHISKINFLNGEDKILKKERYIKLKRL